MSPPEELFATPYFDLSHLDIHRDKVEEKLPREVLEVICAVTAEATRASVEEINRPEETGFIFSHLERVTTPFVEGWRKETLPPPMSNQQWLDYEIAKIAVLLISASGRPTVDGRLRAGREVPYAATRLLGDIRAWCLASEAWAAISFAENQLKRPLSPDRMRLTYSGTRLARANFHLNSVRLWPNMPPEHIPDMTRFGRELSGDKPDEDMACILRAVFGFDYYLFRGVLLALRENQAKNGKAGLIELFGQARLARLLHRFKENSDLDECAHRQALHNLEEKWLAAAQTYSKEVFHRGFLTQTPRVLATVPVNNRNRQSILLCTSATDLTAYEVGHDAVRGAISVPSEVAETRRKLQAAGSAHIAWHQLALCGFQRENGKNWVQNGTHTVFVEAGKSIAERAIPKNLDDLDLVVFDRCRKRIIVCECKYASRITRAPEYRNEFTTFDSSVEFDNRDENIWGRQLRPRIKWLEENKAAMCINGWKQENFNAWTVEGYILTNIIPVSVLAAYGDLPGIRTVGSKSAKNALVG